VQIAPRRWGTLLTALKYHWLPKNAEMQEGLAESRRNGWRLASPGSPLIGDLELPSAKQAVFLTNISKITRL
jgi:hypothetical protein